MPMPSRKTPQRITRMLELHARGASAREIAEEVGISHGSVIAWLKDAGLKPNGGHGTRTRRERITPQGAAAKLVDQQKRLAELEIGAPSIDISTMLVGLHRDLSEARAFVRFHREGAKAGTSSMGDVDRAMVIAERLATKIRELTPAASLDPERDPANLAAAEETRRKFERLVESAEQAYRCKSCGRNPRGTQTNGAPVSGSQRNAVQP
jgi:transposase-like protein